MVALGIVGDRQQLGVEGSGIVRRVGPNVVGIFPGDRVITVNPGLLQTSIVTTPENCWVIPDSLSLEEGATMPIVYGTAIHSLIDVGGLMKGQSVLIHSACGGVGIAAIQICQHIGAEVNACPSNTDWMRSSLKQIFATVSSDEKARYLMDQFGIPHNRIFNSRTPAFLPDVMRETNRRGVDIVLNSLAGKLLHASWDCVASFGKMLELGKRDILTNGTLSMMPFAGNRMFCGVDLLHLSKESPERFQNLVPRFIEWFESGRISPILPRTKFHAPQVVDAFRYMQQGIHMGKVLVQMPQDPADFRPSTTEAELSFSPEASYLLVGGLGGIGRAISTWMVENGARHLVYLSRSAGRSESDQNFLIELEAQGCRATCVEGSVTEFADVRAAVERCVKPLAGVLQMSMVLRDQTFGKMTYDQWTSSLAPKVHGVWNLHHAVQKESLDFFVVFSSLAGVCGNTGQGNYAAANSFADSFSRYRRQLNLPSSSIALGVVEDVGYVSRNPDILHTLRASSARTLGEGEIVKGLQTAIRQSSIKPSAEVQVPSPIIVGLGNTEHSSDRGVRTAWKQDIRFSLYRNIESMRENGAPVNSDHLKLLLAQAEKNPAVLDEPETETRIRWELGQLITKHMPTPEDMDDEQTARITIDSLMSIEIRSWVRRNLGMEINMAEMSKVKTVGQLSGVIMQDLRVKYQEVRKD